MAANVAFIRPEIAAFMDAYYLIRDVIAGEITVKAAGVKYLPMPNAADTSLRNKERYKAYKARAVFYNVSRRTLQGLIGQIFQRPPVLKLPSLLKPIEANATGSGVNLTQLAKKACSLTLAYSRCGLFVDYPTTDGEGGASVADLEAGKVRPTLYIYSPMEIINWRTVDRGAEEVLSLVVIFERYCYNDDGFEMKQAGQFRVLRLDEAGLFVHELWREPTPTSSDGTKIPKGNYVIHEVYLPKDKNGNRLDKIPFQFIGTENNDHNPDNPSFYDMATLNLAHYRNSADYEESCFITGQPTPVVTGLTQDWFKDVLKGELNFGSNGGIPLPENADAKLIQAEPNTMLKEAMDTKERQMVALGAKLVEQKTVQRTATEASLEASSEGSTLSSVAENVSNAFEWALKFAAELVGQSPEEVKYELNKDFDIARMSPEERRIVIEEWTKGAITFDEMRTVLRKAGTATEDDKKAKAQIAADTAEAMALQQPENTPTGGNVGI